MKNDVTIILPFFNAQQFLGSTLRSVESQTYQGWNIILVDDGSTDGSINIAKEFKERNSSRTTLLSTSGVGAAKARNVATDLAGTTYIAFLDADDIWLPKKLEHQIALMKERSYAFSYTAFKKITPDGHVGSTSFPVPRSISRDDLLRTCPIRCFTVVYDQSMIGKLYMPNVRMRNDYLTWFDALARIKEIALKKGLSPESLIIGIDDTLGLYRIHPASLTGNKLKAARYQWRAYRDQLNLPLHQAIYNFTFYAMNGIFNRKKF